MHNDTLVEVSQAVPLYLVGSLVVSDLPQILVYRLNQNNEAECGNGINLETGVETECDQMHYFLFQTELRLCLVVVDREFFHKLVNNLIQKLGN